MVSSSTEVQTCANFFVTSLGSKEAAASYLETLINTIDPLFMRKKRSITDIDGSEDPAVKAMRTSGPSETADFDFDIINGMHENDYVDDNIITFAMQVPNDKGMISNMIGKQGENINDIKLKTGVKTMLENMKTPLKDRAVFFCGKLKATVAAYQLMLKRMVAKAEERALANPGIPQKDVQAEPLIVMIPNELCSRIIGKAGANIKQLQANSGAKTLIETEDQMKAVHSYGRRIVITGNFQQKVHAAYLILRFLCGDNYKDLPSSWKGYTPTPLTVSHPPPPPGGYPGYGGQQQGMFGAPGGNPYGQQQFGGPPSASHGGQGGPRGSGAYGQQQAYGQQAYGQQQSNHYGGGAGGGMQSQQAAVGTYLQQQQQMLQNKMPRM